MSAHAFISIAALIAALAVIRILIGIARRR